MQQRHALCPCCTLRGARVTQAHPMPSNMCHVTMCSHATHCRTSLYRSQSPAMGAHTRWSGIPKESISSLRRGRVQHSHEERTYGRTRGQAGGRVMVQSWAWRGRAGEQRTGGYGRRKQQVTAGCRAEASALSRARPRFSTACLLTCSGAPALRTAGARRRSQLALPQGAPSPQPAWAEVAGKEGSGMRQGLLLQLCYNAIEESRWAEQVRLQGLSQLVAGGGPEGAGAACPLLAQAPSSHKRRVSRSMLALST